MGCRAFLTPDTEGLNPDGSHKYYGRFNQGVVTINLVDVACSAEGDEEKFWQLMEERTELCHKALRIRHETLLGTPSDVAPMKIEFRMDGEISIIFFRCPSCGKGYPISVTDEALRNSMRKYSQLLGKKKQVLGRMQKRLQKLKASNAKRCEELEKLYFPEGERMESDGRIQ